MCVTSEATKTQLTTPLPVRSRPVESADLDVFNQQEREVAELRAIQARRDGMLFDSVLSKVCIFERCA